MKISKATVIGSGCWGSALAYALGCTGRDVTMWGREEDVAGEINDHSTNSKFLPEVKLPESVRATTDLGASVEGAGLILFVLPSLATPSVVEKLASNGVEEGAVFLSCSKGIEEGTGRRMSEIIGASFAGHNVAALSGPNHAEEVSRHLPSAAVIGCENEEVALALQEVFSLPWFRTYTSDDVVGIEIGGAVKNVYAIGAGISEGLGLGDNAKAAFVTRGLAEMSRLGRALGGRFETFQGLSGVGDLIVTCYSKHSRNGTVGRRLGGGEKLSEILATMPTVAEGVPNTKSIRALAQRVKVETPLIVEAYAVLYEDKDPKEALTDLLSRERKPETDPSAER